MILRNFMTQTYFNLLIEKELAYHGMPNIVWQKTYCTILRPSLSLGDGKPRLSLSLSDSKPRLSPEVGDSMGFLSLFIIKLKLYIQKNDILPTQAREGQTFPRVVPWASPSGQPSEKSDLPSLGLAEYTILRVLRAILQFFPLIKFTKENSSCLEA